MRIPLSRAALPLLAACSFLSSCSQPYAVDRLAPGRVPSILDGGSSRTTQPIAASGTHQPESAVTTLSKVPAARVSVAEVHDFVVTLLSQHGRAGLIALDPGDSLVDRLRYCTSRVILARTEEVLPELERLAVDHPDNPLVWRQLGWGHSWDGDRDEADRCMRRAHMLAKRDGFTTCPHLTAFLGKLLLQRSVTRAEGLKLLREELAEGADFVRACRTLVEYFAGREQHAEALACLDAALGRAPDKANLRIGKAKVLLDVHRPDEVIALLEPIVAKPAPDRFAVEILMRARSLKAQFARALALMDLLLTRTDLTADERQDLRVRREGLVVAKREGRKVLFPAWEVYAVLRGHPDVDVRRRMLRSVIAQNAASIREHALHIAFNSASPALRGEALGLLIPRSTQPLVNVRHGLADPSGSVRGRAAALAAGAEKDRDKLAELVLEFLAKETDGYAFRQMHAALGKLTGATIDLPYGAAEDPELRAGIVAKWKQTEQGRQGK